MLAWLANNTATILIAFVLIAVVTVIVVHLVKNKKKGQSSCGCGCRDCPMSGACHQKKITVEAAGQNPAAPFLSGSRSARTGMTIARTSKLWYTGFEHAQDFSPPIYRLDTSDLTPPEATRETKRTPGSALLAV